MANTTQAVVSRLENASVKASLDSIVKMAEALDAIVDVRLIPLEAVRKNSDEFEGINQKQQDAVKGIAYFGLDQLQEVQETKNWINSDQLAGSISMMNIAAWPPIRTRNKKKKDPQIA